MRNGKIMANEEFIKATNDLFDSLSDPEKFTEAVDKLDQIDPDKKTITTANTEPKIDIAHIPTIGVPSPFDDVDTVSDTNQHTSFKTEPDADEQPQPEPTTPDPQPEQPTQNKQENTDNDDHDTTINDFENNNNDFDDLNNLDLDTDYNYDTNDEEPTNPIDKIKNWYNNLTDKQRYTVLGTTATALFIIIAIIIAIIYANTKPQTPDTPQPTDQTQTQETPNQTPTDVTIANITTSCEDGSTPPTMLTDEDPLTSWECIRTLGIDGTVLTINLENTTTITQLGLLPGHADPNQWSNHRTVTRVLWSLGDEQLIQEITPDKNQPATVPVPNIPTSTIQATIQQTTLPKDAAGNEQQTPQDDFAVGQLIIKGVQ